VPISKQSCTAQPTSIVAWPPLRARPDLTHQDIAAVPQFPTEQSDIRASPRSVFPPATLRCYCDYVDRSWGIAKRRAAMAGPVFMKPLGNANAEPGELCYN
jgi:hypothetical protein